MTSFMPGMWTGSAYAEPGMYYVQSQTAAGGIVGANVDIASTPWAFSNWRNTKTNVDFGLLSTKAVIQPQKKGMLTRTMENSSHLISAPQSIHPSILNDLALHRAYKTVGMRPSDLRCFNCLEEKDHQHRRKWMVCSDKCPACPPNKQHYGSFCPKLCMLRKKEDFWKERAYTDFKYEYNEPNYSVESWVRSGFQERACGNEERASGKEESTVNSISPPSQILDTSSKASLPTPTLTPSTPPLSRSPSVTSLASTEGPKTPVTPSKGFVESMEQTHVAELPRSLSNPLIVNSSSAASQVRPPQSRGYYRSSGPTVTASSFKPSGSHQRVDPDRLSFRQSYRQWRSRSPSPELNTTRTYRDRCDILPAVEGQKSSPTPRSHPSISLLFSDPEFVAVIKSEVVEILSCSIPVNAAQQREPFDKISMAVLQAAQAMLRNGVDTRGYQPSTLMERYLKVIHRDFPLLMSRHNADTEVQNTEKDMMHEGIDTYFGHTQTRSISRWEAKKSVSELIWLNQHLIEGTQGSRRRAWDQGDHKLEQDDRGYQANALRRACKSRRQGALKRPVSMDTRKPHWDDAPNKSVTLKYDDAPADRTATFTPRRPHRHHQNPEHRPPARPMQRRHIQQPDNRTKTGRSKQENVALQIGSQAVIAVRRQEPSKEDEVDENTGPAAISDSRDIFSALEDELEEESRGGGFLIAKECWEDLLKGDV